jgi:hypothetical protein
VSGDRSSDEGDAATVLSDKGDAATVSSDEGDAATLTESSEMHTTD